MYLCIIAENRKNTLNESRTRFFPILSDYDCKKCGFSTYFSTDAGEQRKNVFFKLELSRIYKMDNKLFLSFVFRVLLMYMVKMRNAGSKIY